MWRTDVDHPCHLGLFNIFLQIVIGVGTLPLHLLPVIGTLAYCAVNGALVAWEYHEIYFEMLGIPPSKQRACAPLHKPCLFVLPPFLPSSFTPCTTPFPELLPPSTFLLPSTIVHS